MSTSGAVGGLVSKNPLPKQNRKVFFCGRSGSAKLLSYLDRLIARTEREIKTDGAIFSFNPVNHWPLLPKMGCIVRLNSVEGWISDYFATTGSVLVRWFVVFSGSYLWCLLRRQGLSSLLLFVFTSTPAAGAPMRHILIVGYLRDNLLQSLLGTAYFWLCRWGYRWLLEDRSSCYRKDIQKAAETSKLWGNS